MDTNVKNSPLAIEKQWHFLVYPSEQFGQLCVRKHLDFEEDHTVKATER